MDVFVRSAAAWLIVLASVRVAAAGDLFPATLGIDTSPFGDPTAVAAGDLDGDGTLDLVTAHRPVSVHPSGIQILLGNGDGSYQPGLFAETEGAGDSIAIADFDGDSIPDLAVPMSPRSDVAILLGNGDGSFQLPRYFFVGRRCDLASAADLDGDGSPDLVARSPFTGLIVLLGNGDGTFQPGAPVDAGVPGFGLPAIGDLDGDGVADLFAVDSSGSTGQPSTASAVLGNGDGTFQPRLRFDVDDQAIGAALGDLDGDGVLDAVITHLGIAIDEIPVESGTSIWLGAGDGTFSRAGFAATGLGPSWVAAVDVDGDARLDVVTVEETSASVSVLRGRGDGSFAPARSYAVALFAKDLVVADLDGDAAVDLLTITDRGLHSMSVLPGNGDGTFRAPLSVPAVTDTGPEVVAVADLNGDRVADLATAGWAVTPVGGLGPGNVSVFLGLGAGGFAHGLPFEAGPAPLDLAVADVDADDVPDVIAVDGRMGLVDVLTGNGDGTLGAPITFETTAAYPTSLAVADLDGDAIPDVVAADGSSSVGPVLLHGNGDGTFTDLGAVAPGVRSGTVRVADLDGDGISDLVATGADGVLLLPGNGDGTFRPPVRLAETGALAIDDLNGDDALDLVVARDLDVTSLLGRGDGTFEAPRSIHTLKGRAAGIATGDLDRDGAPDVVVSQDDPADGASGWIRVLLGNGDGSARPGELVSGVTDGTRPVIADVDGDGAPDLVAAQPRNKNVRVYLNQSTTAIPIDVQPGSRRNLVNLLSDGLVAVALLGSKEFDVADVDVETLSFGPKHASPVHRRGKTRDVDGDGFLDLVSQYRIPDAGIAIGDEQACVSGATLSGAAFAGCDGIATLPAATGPCGLGSELALLLPVLAALRRARRRARAVRRARDVKVVAPMPS